MATNTIVSVRNKHMQLKMYYIRERMEAGDVSLHLASTHFQCADLLTKNLARPAFEKFRTQLMQPRSLTPQAGSKGACR